MEKIWHHLYTDELKVLSEEVGESENKMRVCSFPLVTSLGS